MGNVATMINFDGHTLFKVLQGASFTVPEMADSPSPAGRSSGVSPTDTFSTKRQAVGGQIVLGFSDVAGNAVSDLQFPLRPGDVVAVSAVASSAVTVTVTPFGGTAKTIATIAATAVAGVVGFWG